MGLFKSKREKTLDALEQLAKQCAGDASKKLTETIEVLRRGLFVEQPGDENTVAVLNDLFQAIYQQEMGAIYGYPGEAAGACMELQGNRSFADNFRYYLYLRLLIRRLQENNAGVLSEEALKEEEKYGGIHKLFRRYFDQAMPGNSVSSEAVETIAFGGSSFLSVGRIYKL